AASRSSRCTTSASGSSAAGTTTPTSTPRRRAVDDPRPRLVGRVTRGEGTLHWSYALLFLILLLSGLGLYLGPGDNPVLDRRELMRTIHLDAAVALCALSLLVAAGSPGTLRRLWRDVEWFDRDDARWLVRVWLPARLRRRPL